MIASTIPETLRICVACERDLACSGSICDGCRADFERHRGCLAAMLEELEGTRGELLLALSNVETLLETFAARNHAAGADAAEHREIVTYRPAGPDPVGFLWVLGATVFAI
ncbi:MAG TPA: hypothetical protein VND66_08200, partial [Acidobacteriaceae bacterium]|nr:hypothetical protein [Acidobacteriaceae bacterium]